MNRCFAVLAVVFRFARPSTAAGRPKVVSFLADDLG